MNYNIPDDERMVLDAVLPFFELNETLNIKKCIRGAMTDLALKNIPINIYSDLIKDFLIKNEFAKNLAGEAVIKAKGIALKNAKSVFGFKQAIQKQHDYIVIDDDHVNNILCSHIIRNAFPKASIKTFIDPNAGLRHLYATYNSTDANDVVVLLDINMPTLMGWDVLDEINTFSDSIKEHFKIFMLTSSINPKDKEKAFSIPILWGYIEKPLTDVKMKTLY